ncbi:MAG TPA: glycosyltransferase, partial [Gemmatimonadaceae bacterium]|nr:glycosyltransferase [Gemmatimonadaceae bacterium]
MTSEALPSMSVVVPVLNGERTLRSCLVSLLATDYPAGRVEVVVVDNGSRDGTAQIARAFPVRYVLE